MKPRLTYKLINDVFRSKTYGQHDIFTARSWSRFVRMHDIDLSRALFAEDGGRIIGTIAFAQRGDRGWLSVMGVLPEYRRRGIGRQLFGGAVEAIRASGVKHVEFEVVQRNEHARKMYEGFGFRIVRELYVWARKPSASAEGVRYERQRLPNVRRIAGESPVCWQRDPIAVSRSGPSALISTDGAYAFVLESGVVADAGARDERSARALVAELDARVPHELTLLNEPQASPLTPALQDAGWRIVDRQFQMMGTLQ